MTPTRWSPIKRRILTFPVTPEDLQVMLWGLPRAQSSPPLGEVAVIVWDWEIADTANNKTLTKASFFMFPHSSEYLERQAEFRLRAGAPSSLNKNFHSPYYFLGFLPPYIREETECQIKKSWRSPISGSKLSISLNLLKI